MEFNLTYFTERRGMRLCCTDNIFSYSFFWALIPWKFSFRKLLVDT